jgi:hypothetical protein
VRLVAEYDSSVVGNLSLLAKIRQMTLVWRRETIAAPRLGGRQCGGGGGERREQERYRFRTGDHRGDFRDAASVAADVGAAGFIERARRGPTRDEKIRVVFLWGLQACLGRLLPLRGLLFHPRMSELSTKMTCMQSHYTNLSVSNQKQSEAALARVAQNCPARGDHTAVVHFHSLAGSGFFFWKTGLSPYWVGARG